MFKTNYFLNPKRNEQTSLRVKVGFYTKLPLIKLGLWLGFQNIEYSYVHGCKSRLSLGMNCSTMNTIFNVISGDVSIGDDTLFGHNCMVLTGTHEFYDGRRASLSSAIIEETPVSVEILVLGMAVSLALV